MKSQEVTPLRKHQLLLANPPTRNLQSHFSSSRLNGTGRLFFRLAIGLSLLLSIIFFSFRPAKALTLDSTRWYLRDQDVGIQLIGNVDNTGKSLFCPTTDDCKVVYYDNTNGDLKFFDCDDPTCSTGTATTVASAGNVGDQLSLFCVTGTDCKIAFVDETNTALLFFDCDNSTCSTGTLTVVDGNTGCSLTGGVGCSADRKAGTYPVVYCPTSDDCKIAYGIDGASALYFTDCDTASCSAGSITVLDGANDCVLTGCVMDTPSSNQVGQHMSMVCLATDDCKISVKNGSTDDLRFEDCNNATCSSGTSTLLDGNTGCALTGGDGCSPTDDVGKQSNLFCPSTDDCKIAYVSNTNSSLRFADCDNAACSAGSVSFLDGEPGCSLTNCSSTVDANQPSLFCPDPDNCQIIYYQKTGRELHLVDCDNATCGGPGAGTIYLLDGSAGCLLTNCSSVNSGQYASLYCLSASDCKMIYYDEVNGNLKFAACEQPACASGSTLTIDGNKMIANTPGDITTTKKFGSTNGKTLLFVTDVAYPTTDTDDVIGPGTYTLHLNFTNNITSGTLVWNFSAGYCTTSSDCNDRTIHASSPDQTITSAMGPSMDISISSAPDLTIPAPAHTKWLYLEMHVSSLATGSITINMNNSAGSGADSYLEYDPSTNPTPTPSPTPSPTTISFQPAEDTFITSSAPTTNYGSKKTIGADNSPIVNSLLRFDVSGIPQGATILSTTLRLYINNGSDRSGSLSGVSGTWSEATTTWSSAPTIGPWLADLGNPATSYGWVEADLTGWITSNGTYDLYLSSASSDNVTYNSREAGLNAPKLVIEYLP